MVRTPWTDAARYDSREARKTMGATLKTRGGGHLCGHAFVAQGVVLVSKSNAKDPCPTEGTHFLRNNIMVAEMQSPRKMSQTNGKAR